MYSKNRMGSVRNHIKNAKKNCEDEEEAKLYDRLLKMIQDWEDVGGHEPETRYMNQGEFNAFAQFIYKHGGDPVRMDTMAGVLEMEPELLMQCVEADTQELLRQISQNQFTEKQIDEIMRTVQVVGQMPIPQQGG